jgi:hypothetical protein
MEGRQLERLGGRGGQFFLWRFLTKSRWWQAHPFSLSATPDGSALRITVKDVGDFTKLIGEIKPGTRVLADGPYGRAFAPVVGKGAGSRPAGSRTETMPCTPQFISVAASTAASWPPGSIGSR